MRFIIPGILFGFLMGVYDWVSNGIGSPFPFGSSILSGIFFGVGIALITPHLSRRAKAKVDLQGETPMLEGPANHVLNFESRGGQLILTRNHLWFFSHGMNVQNNSESIEISRINKVEASKAMGIVPNAFSVILDSSVEHKFIVSGRNKWMEELHKIRTSTSGSIVK